MATLDQSFTTAFDDSNGFRYDAATKIAQQFTPSHTADVVQVDITVCKIGSPTGNVWVEIWSDTGANLPNAKIGDSSATVDVSTLPADEGNADWETFTFTGISVTSGTKYWIVINGNYTVSTSNYARWSKKGTGGYTGGIPAFYTGSEWNSSTLGTTVDFLFKEYDDYTPAGFFAIL